jgi:tRNA A-37 threonylcarbamoyl transferase component Bud32
MQAAPRDDPDDIDRVSALLAQVLEAPLASQPDVLAALCAEHQDCALALQQAYESLQRLDLVQVAQSKDEGGPGTVLGGLPRTLGPFRLLEFLGAGGMGAVYRAEDEELKRPVALKLVRSELLASPRTRSRFQRESAALARLDHPGLCTAYRAGSTDGQPWIAMRLVRGTTLAQGIEARRAGQSRQGSGVATMRRSSHTRRDLRHTLLLFEKIARALATAHAVGVVHRDIKPGNIVLTSEDEPVVIDFGLVHLEDSDSHLTMSGDHIGTPAYMAPEQVDAAGRDVAPTTDIYALGVTLFEALTLESPYQARSREELYHCILRGKRRRLRQVLRSLPADLEMVLEKALDLEPARRYASMVEFADDLRRYLAHEPLMAGPPSGWYRLRKLVRRNPGQVMAGSAVFVTAVVGAVVALQFALGEQAKVREFDLLSGVVLYDNAIAAEKELYPPWPHKIAAMEHWLQDDAGRVLAMKEDIERTVRDLEARALPQTEAERDADRRSHPKLAALDLLTKRVTSLRYAQAIREGKAQLVLPVLTAEQQALGFDALFVMAWPRVDPGQADRTIWGEEPLGLALARAAAAKAHGTDAEYKVLDLLAWALLANGQDAEAKARSEEALGNAPDIEQEAYLGHQRNLDAEVAQAATILSTAEKERDDLATVLNERHTFRFELESQRFLHYTLAELLAKIGSLASKQVREVDMRVAWARQIQGLSLAHPKARPTTS